MTKPIYVVLEIGDESCPDHVVNAFESSEEAYNLYPDSYKYEIVKINLNLSTGENEDHTHDECLNE